jgi:predicted RNA-binding Zn ribbon-like protein
MSEEQLKMVGGRLCLDFTNTVGSHDGDHPGVPHEWLTDYAALVWWARQAEVLSEAAAERLLEEARRRPQEAQATFETAITLREALYGIFSAVAAGREAGARHLETLNSVLSRSLGHRRVASTGEGFVWEWAATEEELEQPLWPVALSAAELLVADELTRVRECNSATCGWLFLDMSRNRSRRWCDMQECGNVAKVRRFRRRRRQE